MCYGFDGAHEQRAVIVIVRNGAANGFSCTDAVFIVAVDIRIRASGGCGFRGIRLQPLTFPNQSCTEVVRRVAGSVICYAFAIVRSELILPCRVCVGIGNGLPSRAERSDSVSIDLFVEQIAPNIVFICNCSVAAVAAAVIKVLPYELVRRIINI